jgi:hypothetical protein
MSDGEVTSLAIILVGISGAGLVAVLRHAELTRYGVPYWTPARRFVLKLCALGLIALVGFHWLAAAVGPVPVQ